MQFGETDGKHFAFNIALRGFSVFVPETKWNYAAWFGFSVCNAAGRFAPVVGWGRIGKEPSTFYTVLRYLTAPYNVSRVGRI